MSHIRSTSGSFQKYNKFTEDDIGNRFSALNNNFNNQVTNNSSKNVKTSPICLPIFLLRAIPPHQRDPAHAFSELKKESRLFEKTTSQSKCGTVNNQIEGWAGARVGIAILEHIGMGTFEKNMSRTNWREAVGI